MGYANGSGARVKVAVLVVTPLRSEGVGVEFDVNGVGGTGSCGSGRREAALGGVASVVAIVEIVA